MLIPIQRLMTIILLCSLQAAHAQEIATPRPKIPLPPISRGSVFKPWNASIQPSQTTPIPNLNVLPDVTVGSQSVMLTGQAGLQNFIEPLRVDTQSVQKLKKEEDLQADALPLVKLAGNKEIMRGSLDIHSTTANPAKATSRSFANLIAINNRNPAPFNEYIVALVTFEAEDLEQAMRRTTPPIKEDEEAELVAIAEQLTPEKLKKLSKDLRDKFIAERVERQESQDPRAMLHKLRKERSSRHMPANAEIYDAVKFNIWHYGDYPLTFKSLTHPQHVKHPEYKSAIKSVEYYALSPQSAKFFYKTNDTDLIASNQKMLWLAWLNAHQNQDMREKAEAAAEYGSMVAFGDYAKPDKQRAKVYLLYALKQADSNYARALAAYSLGKLDYYEYMSVAKQAPERKQLRKQAIEYLKEAYQVKKTTLTPKTDIISALAAYYLAMLSRETEGIGKQEIQQQKEKAEKYLKEALTVPSAHSLPEESYIKMIFMKSDLQAAVLDQLENIREVATCCGISFMKKRNKVAANNKERKLAFAESD